MPIKVLFATVAGLLATASLAGPAAAQSTGSYRTFVSGTGIDNSTCIMPYRPCRTLAYALARTMAGGAVVAQNAAEYGPASITQAVSIIGPDKGGAIVNGGVTIDVGSATVSLRGLEITGADQDINLVSFGNLILTDSMTRGGSYGIISFASGNVTLTNSVIADAGDTGIYLGGGNLVMTGSLVNKAGNIGISVSGGTRVVDSIIVNSGTALSVVGNAFVKGSTFAGNNIGLTLASNSTVALDTTTIVGNGTGTSAINNGSTINSYGTNNVTGNGVNSSGTPITRVSAN